MVELQRITMEASRRAGHQQIDCAKGGIMRMGEAGWLSRLRMSQHKEASLEVDYGVDKGGVPRMRLGAATLVLL
jgi:hypothetical protein